MPCRSDYLEHSWREAESGAVLEFLKEIRGEPFNHDEPSYYGRVETLDDDTVRLCHWCESHDVSHCSLELQLWWQQHQKEDQRRRAREAREQALAAMKATALSKLSEEEARALGVEKP